MNRNLEAQHEHTTGESCAKQRSQLIELATDTDLLTSTTKRGITVKFTGEEHAWAVNFTGEAGFRTFSQLGVWTVPR